jgi:hypothetical protein
MLGLEGFMTIQALVKRSRRGVRGLSGFWRAPGQ